MSDSLSAIPACRVLVIGVNHLHTISFVFKHISVGQSHVMFPVVTLPCDQRSWSRQTLGPVAPQLAETMS